MAPDSAERRRAPHGLAYEPLTQTGICSQPYAGGRTGLCHRYGNTVALLGLILMSLSNLWAQAGNGAVRNAGAVVLSGARNPSAHREGDRGLLHNRGRVSYIRLTGQGPPH